MNAEPMYTNDPSAKTHSPDAYAGWVPFVSTPSRGQSKGSRNGYCPFYRNIRLFPASWQRGDDTGQIREPRGDMGCLRDRLKERLEQRPELRRPRCGLPDERSVLQRNYRELRQ